MEEKKAAELQEKKFRKTVKVRFQGPCPKEKTGFIEELSKEFKCIKIKPGPLIKKYNSWHVWKPLKNVQTFFVHFKADEDDAKEKIKNNGNQLLLKRKKYFVVHDECNICYYKDTEGAEIILFSCNPLHMSCKNCIFNFQNKRCPWCKKAITTKREILDKIRLLVSTTFLTPLRLLLNAGQEFSHAIFYYYSCVLQFEYADLRTGIRDYFHIFVVPEIFIMILNYLGTNQIVNLDMNAKWKFVVWIIVWNINKQLRKKLKFTFSELQLYIILNNYFYFSKILLENCITNKYHQLMGTLWTSKVASDMIELFAYLFWGALTISLYTQLLMSKYLLFPIVTSAISRLPSFAPLLTSAAFLTMQYFSGDFYSTRKKVIIKYFGANPKLPYGRLTFDPPNMIEYVEYAFGCVFLIESYRIYQQKNNINVWNFDWKKIFARPFEMWFSGFVSYGKIFLSLTMSIFGIKPNISRKEVLNYGRALLIPEFFADLLNCLHINPTFEAKDLIVMFALWFFGDFFNQYLMAISQRKIGFTDLQLSIFLTSWIGGTISGLFFMFRSLIFQDYGANFAKFNFPSAAIIAILASLLSFHPLLIAFVISLTGTVMMFWGDEHYSNANDFYLYIMPAKQRLPYSPIQYDPDWLLFYGKLAVYTIIFQNTAVPLLKAYFKHIWDRLIADLIQGLPVDFTT